MAIIATTDLAAFAVKTVNLPRDEAQAGRDRVNFLRTRLEKHIADNPGFSLVKMCMQEASQRGQL